MKAEIYFFDDDEAVSFVKWAYHSTYPRVLESVVSTLIDKLNERGWTRHGYCDDEWCPPGKIYIAHQGIYDADDPHAIAGLWQCKCGYETDRLAHALGHMELAEKGASLQFPGPHEMSEVENRGPQHKEWGEYS